MTTCTHVFTADAIAECERAGHRWAWVPAWHDRGFWECGRCGATGQAGTLAEKPTPLPPPPENPLEILAMTERSRQDLASRMVMAMANKLDRELVAFAGDDPGAPSLPLCGRPVSASSVVPPSRLVATGASSRDARATRRGSGADRDTQIADLYRDGKPVTKIAEQFGVTECRIYQILRRQRDAAGGAS